MRIVDTLKVRQRHPPARAYFNFQMSGIDLEKDGRVRATMHVGFDRKYYTVSSDERWRNIGVPFEYSISGEKGYLHVNGLPVICKPR